MKRKHRGALLWVLPALALLCAAAADSNTRLVTTEYRLDFPNLPEAFDGFRVVQLSDLHGAVFGAGNARLLSAVRRAEPDLIALTGDLADKDTDLGDIDALVAALTELAPVYYVSGNHEWSDGPGLLSALRAIFDDRGVRYLRNEAVTLSRGGGSIVLAGVEDPNGWADQPTPAQVAESLPGEPGDFRLLLAHRNDFPAKYPALPVDLILCGHAHGGMVRLPLVGAVFGHGALFPRWTSGVWRSGRYRMVVSRGLGNTGRSLRFGNNPELVAVTLCRGETV